MFVRTTSLVSSRHCATGVTAVRCTGRGAVVGTKLHFGSGGGGGGILL